MITKKKIVLQTIPFFAIQQGKQDKNLYRDIENGRFEEKYPDVILHKIAANGRAVYVVEVKSGRK